MRKALVDDRFLYFAIAPCTEIDMLNESMRIDTDRNPYLKHCSPYFGARHYGRTILGGFGLPCSTVIAIRFRSATRSQSGSIFGARNDR
jgi:hypothetical protein